MKKSYLFKITILFTCLISFWVIAGCSSSDGGGVFFVGGGAATTSALTKTVALSGSSYEAGEPFANINGVSMRTMMLYNASEMKGAGTITSISFKYGQDLASNASCPNTTIKMSHTNLTGLNATVASNINTGQGSQQTVLTSSTVTIPVGTAGGYYTIPLTTPFNYNGVDELVVDINHDNCSGAVSTASHGGGVDLTNVAVNGAATGLLMVWRPDTQFNLSGGDSIAVGLSGAGANYYPFTSTPTGQKVQLLYTNDEINGSGPVTGIAFPAGLITLGGNYTINVRMGHTNLTSFVDGSAFASNFNIGTPVTVANAVNFNVPAGVPVDSYIWIPMPNASFNYNGTDNLIVEIEVTSAGGNATAWEKNNTPPLPPTDDFMRLPVRRRERMIIHTTASNSVLPAGLWMSSPLAVAA